MRRFKAASDDLLMAGMAGWLCHWSSHRWAEPFPGLIYMSGWAWFNVTLFSGVGALLLLLLAIGEACQRTRVRQRDERGSIVIWMMGLVMMVLLLSGLCLDIWRAVAAERSLATAVDAAAAAGANGIDEAAYRNSGTVQLDPGKAESLASDSLSQQPEFPRMDGVSVSATTARVTVSGGMVVRLTLMRIFVRSDPHVTATADAQPRRGS